MLDSGVPRSSAQFFPLRRHTGSLALGLAITCCLVGVAAALSARPLRRVRVESRARSVVSDLRGFTRAFQLYAQAKGDWPARVHAPGTVPPGMTEFLGKTNWTRPTPIGGRYTWAPDSLHQGERYHAAIVFASTGDSTDPSDPEQLRAVDRAIDDGDLATGKFRLGFRNQPVWVIEH